MNNKDHIVRQLTILEPDLDLLAVFRTREISEILNLAIIEKLPKIKHIKDC